MYLSMIYKRKKVILSTPCFIFRVILPRYIINIFVTSEVVITFKIVYYLQIIKNGNDENMNLYAIINSNGPNSEPWWAPEVTSSQDDVNLLQQLVICFQCKTWTNAANQRMYVCIYAIAAMWHYCNYHIPSCWCRALLSCKIASMWSWCHDDIATKQQSKFL